MNGNHNDNGTADNDDNIIIIINNNIHSSLGITRSENGGGRGETTTRLAATLVCKYDNLMFAQYAFRTTYKDRPINNSN